MAINAQRTVVGVFDERALAEKTIEDLQNAGFSPDQIYYSGSDENQGEYYDTAFWQRITRIFFHGKPLSHDALTKQLKDLGFSDDEILHYDNEYRLGRAIVAVKADGREEVALAFLRVNGAHN
jgi:hypothetical protein